MNWIILIIAGLYTILKSNLALSLIGLIMMIYAVLEIVGFVFNKENDNSDATITITKDENKNVKDAKVVEVKDKKQTKKSKK